MAETLFTKEVRDALTKCERGNTLAKGDDGGLVFLTTVEGNLRFFVEHLPDNYPSTYTFFRTLTDDKLITVMRKSYGGWSIWKNNHNIPMTANDEILGLDKDDEDEDDEDEEGQDA